MGDPAFQSNDLPVHGGGVLRIVPETGLTHLLP